jgi:cytosine/uracil/thiamine/allantoin permease
MYKSFLFTICVAVLSVIEFMIRAFLKTKGFSGVQDMFMRCFSYEWFAGMLVAFAVFIPFFAIRELGRVLGRGKISELFFRKGTDAKTNLLG